MGTDIRNTQGRLIINKGFKEHDEIRSKIWAFNYSKGLRHVLDGAWTYEKLAQNASDKLGIPFNDAWKLGVDVLIEHAQ